MEQKKYLPNLDQRIALFDLIITLNKEALEYFGNANCALIFHVLELEQYKNFRERGQIEFSVGVTLSYLAERTGLPKSTVHDQLKKMLEQDIFVKEGQKYKFKIGPDGKPVIQTKFPKGLASLRKFTNFLRNTNLVKE